MPLHWLIAQAYNLPFQSSRLTGGPEWTHSEFYDIQAAAPGVFAPGSSAKDRAARTRFMLQALLAERFHLVMRRETKELPACVIVPAKRGVKLKPASIQEKDCPVDPPDSGIYCHHLSGGMGRGLPGPAVDVADIATYVGNWMDRPVADQSGIKGLYSVDTEGWTPITPSIPNPNAPAPTGGENVNDPNRPGVFSVFEETLGLKLEPKKAKVEMFVIDKVQRPTAN